eukprot:563421-Prymnesium_polylepis.1
MTAAASSCWAAPSVVRCCGAAGAERLPRGQDAGWLDVAPDDIAKAGGRTGVCGADGDPFCGADGDPFFGEDGGQFCDGGERDAAPGPGQMTGASAWEAGDSIVSGFGRPACDATGATVSRFRARAALSAAPI